MGAGRGRHAVFLDPAGVDGAGVLRAMVAVMHEPVGAAMRRGPGGRLFQRLQRQLLRVHGGGAHAQPTMRRANTSVTNAV